MLVLTRWPGQSILIGDDIEVIIVEVRDNGRVRIGVDAPRTLQVDRKEIRQKQPRAANGEGLD
jgi:carbon storage regulator